MKRRKESTLIIVLEWICGIAAVLAIITTSLATFVYKERNGRFLPEMEQKKAAVYTDKNMLSTAKTPQLNANNLQKDPNASSETPIPQQPQGQGIKNVSIAGFKTLTIAANTTEIIVNFYNPTANEGEFQITFELLLPTANGEYETMYKSGLVYAGQHIRNISLAHPVEAGTYENCILRIQPYFISDGNPASMAEVSFTLFAD